MGLSMKTPYGSAFIKEEMLQFSPGQQEVTGKDETFERLHSGRLFIRSDPDPKDIKRTAEGRLINNKNEFRTFINKDAE